MIIKRIAPGVYLDDAVYRPQKFEVVQIYCKDCKYWEVDNDVGFCTRTEDCDWNADDFCSKGERRGKEI